MTVDKSLPVLMMGLLLVGCGGRDGDQTRARDHDQDPHDRAAAAASVPDLELDTSAKWEMDKHTRLMFAKMNERLAGTDLDAAGEELLMQSGVALRKDIDRLIAGCTMAGDAHDELHKFLAVYIPAVDQLATSGASESAERVEKLLEIYGRYFE